MSATSRQKKDSKDYRRLALMQAVSAIELVGNKGALRLRAEKL